MLKSSKSGLADTVYYSLLSWLIYECYKSVFENLKYCLCVFVYACWRCGLLVEKVRFPA